MNTESLQIQIKGSPSLAWTAGLAEKKRRDEPNVEVVNS